MLIFRVRVRYRRIKVNVPCTFNEEQCAGRKLGGGMIQKQANDIEVSACQTISRSTLKSTWLDVELGQIVHLSDIPLPRASPHCTELGSRPRIAVALVLAPGFKEATADETS